ncbi:precorrin-8X methylmutase [Aestuariivirga litoralis]|uniref:precorrin-8X methylmutase n=1 Tax=Aestuariivirga litoralis TaxID=2650924 RepID=UPI0018C7BFA9|nr:precorrin-8X methylmutase [Aestuariivirga litoralis]MBG1231348.1 precorrin-8X methylmutase [Aestuariivirga litoralis]
MNDYLRDPSAIYARSFAIIRAEADLRAIPASAHQIAIRVIHSCGMVEVANDLVITEDFAAAAQAALDNGKPILVDAEMVRHGIIARQLPPGVEIICTLNDPRAKELGIATSTTRTAAAVELWQEKLAGAIVVIGNAPTALFRLLELVDAGAPKPACIVGMPVGFVGAAESKDALIANPRGIPYATIKGRKGGSAMASSVINALTSDQP